MNLLHVVGTYPLGTHPFVLWQLRGAIDLGHEVKVLAAHHGNEAGEAMTAQLHLPDGICTYANYRDFPTFHFDLRRFTPRVARAADRQRYGRMLAEQRKSYFCALLDRPALRNVDLIQAHFITWAIEVGLPLARLLNRPCVVTAHTAVDDIPTDSLEFVQREADAVVVVSDGDLRAWAARTGSDAKLHRVWNGIPLTGHERKPDDAPTGRIKLITAGRLEPSKRIADIIEGVHRLRVAGIDCELQIFGEGPLHEELAATILAYRLQDHIQLRGAVPHAQVMTGMAAADILVHASELESFGLVMVEAMSVNLPVVAAASTGAREIVLNGTTGLLFPVADVGALVDAVHRLSEDRELRKRMGTAGRQRVEDTFSLAAHMGNMNALWTSLHR